MREGETKKEKLIFHDKEIEAKKDFINRLHCTLVFIVSLDFLSPSRARSLAFTLSHLNYLNFELIYTSLFMTVCQELHNSAASFRNRPLESLKQLFISLFAFFVYFQQKQFSISAK